MDILSWYGIEGSRYYLSVFAMLLSHIYYFVIIGIDFKYKEMEYWRILLACGINIVTASVVYGVFNSWSEALVVGLCSIGAFVVLSFLNGLLNKERVVGQADVDVFLCQAILTGVIILKITQTFTDGLAIQINAIYVLQVITTCIFVGLLATVVIWIFVIMFDKFKNKKSFKTSVHDNRSVPTLIAFIPWIYANMYIILGF